MPELASPLRAAAKPPRLRAACNQCHIAKARCSGEKQGCLRCSTYNLKCEYQLSMVGRAPKRRRSGSQHAVVFPPKERPPTSPSEAVEPSQQSEVHQGASAFTPRNLLDNSGDIVHISMTEWRPLAPASGDTYLSFHLPESDDPALASSVVHTPSDAVWNSAAATKLGIPGVDNLDGHRDISVACQHLTCNANGCISSLDDFSFPELASEQGVPFSTLPGRDVAFTQLDPLARSSRLVPTGYRDPNAVARYPHAAMLMNIIDGLESCLQQTASVDHILNLNRMAMAKLPFIMEMEGFKACNSCPILGGTVLDLMISMYSMALSTGQTSPEHVRASGVRSAEPAGGLRSEPYLPRESTAPLNVINIGNQATSSSETPNAVSEPLFTFGCLELEPEEHIMLRNVVLKRDLRKCIQTVQSYRREMQDRWEAAQQNLRGTRGPSSFISSSRSQDLWYAEMEKKVEELVASIDDA